MRILLAILFLFVTMSLWAQNLDDLGERDPFKITGGVNFTGIGYGVNGIESRRDPFSWYMNGSLAANIYGWSVPFSFSYSNQQRSFRQPFNRYGLAPQYKWIKTYLGYNNISYSNYTLNGHVFLGGAVELTPGDFRINAMVGRLQKAVEEDTLNDARIIPAYQRMGYAFQVGYGKGKSSIDLILFKAEDDENSLNYHPRQEDVRPQENLVLSIIGKQQIMERLMVSAEFASSAFTRNTLDSLSESGSTNLPGSIGGLFTPRASSEFYNAFNTHLAYQGDIYTVQLNYERVDPGYRTLGAYFFNNDLENVTVSGSVKLLKDKLNVAANTGTQRNNLADTEVSATRRWINAVNLSYAPDQKWNFNGSYSNFTTFTNVRPRFDPFFEDELDTLNFYQINQNATASVSYNLPGNKSNRQSIFFTGSYQIAEDDTGNEADTVDRGNTFMNGNLAYRLSMVEQQMSLSAGFNFLLSEFGGQTTNTFGPNVSVNRSFLDKQLRGGLSYSYNQQNEMERGDSKITSIRLNANFTPRKSGGKTEQGQSSALIGKGQHGFSMNAIYLRKSTTNPEQPDFGEITVNFNYNYRF